MVYFLRRAGFSISRQISAFVFRIYFRMMLLPYLAFSRKELKMFNALV